ncbi:flavin reductase [Agromyces archimandritae]|uniref:Flavin reductase n=1 Tax=Agromyces archimandritae TaxID=2781962 RepID=A0A975IN99_9MICO|nr:flavin reductase [Agromyces archimandritae]QTX04388.1 flavin reductase [Agromyces archimandritae]
MSDHSPGAMAATQDGFKQAARRFASGVTVVTTRLDDDTVHGITVSSFASLSINPLLITVSLMSESRMLGLVKDSQRFAVSILGEDQQDVSAYFATRGRPEAKGGFDGIRTVAGITGSPIVDGAVAYFDCEVHEIVAGGDHEILVGSVVATGGSSGKPLLYYDGDYRSLPGDDDRLADGVRMQVRLAGLETGEILETQSAMDPAVAALAAAHATAEDLEELQRLLDEEAAAIGDQVGFTRVGMDFHVALAKASKNRFLHASLEALQRERQLLFAPRNEIAKSHRSHDYHLRLVDAIAAGDPQAARALMAEHVGVIGEGLQSELQVR